MGNKVKNVSSVPVEAVEAPVVLAPISNKFTRLVLTINDETVVSDSGGRVGNIPVGTWHAICIDFSTGTPACSPAIVVTAPSSGKNTERELTGFVQESVLNPLAERAVRKFLADPGSVITSPLHASRGEVKIMSFWMSQ